MKSIPQLIQKKRDGQTLTREEIQAFIQGASRAEIPDYQISAFLMAVFFQGMSLEETAIFTRAMVDSGESFDLSAIPGPKVDKHSTGGIGDKVSIILAPLAAACGLKVPMMAGRGLGHTGGTIDKLESIPGYRAILDRDTFFSILKDIGCAIISQSKTIAPADRKFYAIRDVTATIECIPLITSSILSKKIAEGAEGLVMDIKVGNGAFMKKKTEAILLARTLRSVGKKSGLNVRATLSNMDQPLGYAAGNAVEIYECIEVMQNKTLNPHSLVSLDLRELTIHLCAQMLDVGGITKSLAEGRKLATQKLQDGSAWKKFVAMIEAQGGNSLYLNEPWRLLQAKKVVEIHCKKKGFVTEMDTEGLGRLLIQLGGGRNRTEDTIDHRVGFFFHRKLGSMVRPEDPFVTIFGGEETDFSKIEQNLRAMIRISSTKKSGPNLILEPHVR